MNLRFLAVVVLLVAVGPSSLVHAGHTSQQRHSFTCSPWCLPTAVSPLHHRHVEGTSIVSFVRSLRGGSDGYYQGNDSDRRRRRDADDYYYNGDDRGREDDRYYYNEQEGGFDNDDRQYNDYDDRGRSRRKSSGDSSLSSSMPTILKTGDRKIGLLLLGSGGLVTFLGITMFFNKTLLRMGNLLIICGVPMTIGPGRTMGYFFQPRKARSTACLALGILLVLMKHPILGMALEIFGLMNLFGNMFPLAMAMMKQMPFIGPLLKSSTKPRRNERDRGDYYNSPHDDHNYGGYGDDDRRGDPGSNERYY